MKKDLKDHMNSLEERLISTTVNSGGAAGGTDTGGTEEALRLVVREELTRMLRAERAEQ